MSPFLATYVLAICVCAAAIVSGIVRSGHPAMAKPLAPPVRSPALPKRPRRLAA